MEVSAPLNPRMDSHLTPWDVPPRSMGRTRPRPGKRAALAATLCLGLCTQAPAQVYVGEHSSGGGVVLSNFQTRETPDLLLASSSEGVPESTSSTRLQARMVHRPTARSDRWNEVINSMATAVDISPQLLHAVISAESNYDHQAVSPKGAIGLMQLMPATARRFGVKDPHVARDNVLAGASYLKWLMGYFHGDLELVLAAYNAGEQAVVRAGYRVPKYPETQAYVRRIMAGLKAPDASPM